MTETNNSNLIPNSVLFNKKISARSVAECPLKGKENEIDYKNPTFLTEYVSEKGRILPRRLTGLCSKTHRKLVRAIKVARNLALLPFSAK